MWSEPSRERIFCWISGLDPHLPSFPTLEGCALAWLGNGIAHEVITASTGIGDIWDIGRDSLPGGAVTPGFYVWDGEVTFTEDDYYTGGSGWRKATGAELVRLATGRNPFDTTQPLQPKPATV